MTRPTKRYPVAVATLCFVAGVLAGGYGINGAAVTARSQKQADEREASGISVNDACPPEVTQVETKSAASHQWIVWDRGAKCVLVVER